MGGGIQLSRKDLAADNSGGGVRTSLDQSVEFRRWLDNKRADAVRASDRIGTEIDTLMAELDTKRVEQRELDEIIARCDAALTIDLSAKRQAPALTTRENPVKDALEGDK